MSERALMRPCYVLFAAALLLQPITSFAEGPNVVRVSIAPPVSGLSPDEASTILGKLADAQRRLSNGQFENFELLSGSIASYEMTKVPPREAFLKVPFSNVSKIEKIQSERGVWQRYRLVYPPNGAGHLYWDIDVAIGPSGDIEQVVMSYKPAAPF